jgi:predicted GIY-YIG superfamily endonuclease
LAYKRSAPACSVILNEVKDLARSSARLSGELLRLHHEQQVGSALQFDRLAEMVARERQLKGWTRSGKIELIHSQNPEMADYARRTARDPSRSLP